MGRNVGIRPGIQGYRVFFSRVNRRHRARSPRGEAEAQILYVTNLRIWYGTSH